MNNLFSAGLCRSLLADLFLLFLSASFHFTAAQESSVVKALPIPGETFLVQSRAAFLITAQSPAKAKPWVWYAPTLPSYPAKEEQWMFQQFIDAGISVAGIDVGESYGSPAGRKLFTALYNEMHSRGFSSKPVLLGRSRGGLMTLSWAAENPDKLSAFAGIYPVCNLASYPGIAKAAPAYELTADQLQAELKQHNPIDRLAPLAQARIPLFAIHGDVDTLVPLDDNSKLLHDRYTALGGSMQLIVPPGQGHNMWTGFFQSQELVEFVQAHALSPTTADYIELTAEIELNDWSYWFLEDRSEHGQLPTNQRSIFSEPLKVRCVIGANTWLMEGQFVRNAIVTRWFTGTNLVEQTRIIAPTSIPPAANSLNLRVSAPPVGQVSTRSVETSDGNPARPVRVEDLFPDAIGKVSWLAFCSGSALRREGRQIPLPSSFWKQFFSGKNFTDKTEFFDDSLALPKIIELHESNQHLLLNYQVRSSTNFHGRNIPLEFYLLQYKPAPPPYTNSLELHLTAKGRVTSIHATTAPSIPRD